VFRLWKAYMRFYLGESKKTHPDRMRSLRLSSRGKPVLRRSRWQAPAVLSAFMAAPLGFTMSKPSNNKLYF
jgi:hypothetical protein